MNGSGKLLFLYALLLNERGLRDIIAKRYFMRKFLCLLLCIGLLSGCKKTAKASEQMMASYEGYYLSVQDNERFQAASDYYRISGEITQIADGGYRYYIFLDSPQIAMYDVVMLAVENDTPVESAKKMMPSIGVFEKKDYSLVPFQTRVTAGYVKGLVLSGECAEPSVDLKLMVEWRDQSRKNAYREYLAFTLDQDGYDAEGNTDTQGEAVND